MDGYEFSSGISCLGYDPDMIVASSCGERGVTRWSYLSGKYLLYHLDYQQRLVNTTLKHPNIIEDSKKAKPFDLLNAVKPGLVLGRPNASGIMELTLNLFANPLLQTKYAVHRDDIAKAMIYAILAEMQVPYSVYENEDIKEKAKQYDLLI